MLEVFRELISTLGRGIDLKVPGLEADPKTELNK